MSARRRLLWDLREKGGWRRRPRGASSVVRVSHSPVETAEERKPVDETDLSVPQRSTGTSWRRLHRASVRQTGKEGSRRGRKGLRHQPPSWLSEASPADAAAHAAGTGRRRPASQVEGEPGGSSPSTGQRRRAKGGGDWRASAEGRSVGRWSKKAVLEERECRRRRRGKLKAAARAKATASTRHDTRPFLWKGRATKSRSAA